MWFSWTTIIRLLETFMKSFSDLYSMIKVFYNLTVLETSIAMFSCILFLCTFWSNASKTSDGKPNSQKFCPLEVDLRSLHTESEIYLGILLFLIFLFLILSYQNARCENAENQTWSTFFWWWTKVLEAVCKRNWQIVRSYLFFNMRTFRIQCALNDLWS